MVHAYGTPKRRSDTLIRLSLFFPLFPLFLSVDSDDSPSWMTRFLATTLLSVHVITIVLHFCPFFVAFTLYLYPHYTLAAIIV